MKNVLDELFVCPVLIWERKAGERRKPATLWRYFWGLLAYDRERMVDDLLELVGTSWSNQEISYATRPLSRCYLRSYLVKNTAWDHKESNTKHKNKWSHTEEQDTSNDELNTSIIIKHLSHALWQFLSAGLRDSADLIKVLNMSKITRTFTSSTEV